MSRSVTGPTSRYRLRLPASRSRLHSTVVPLPHLQTSRAAPSPRPSCLLLTRVLVVTSDPTRQSSQRLSPSQGPHVNAICKSFSPGQMYGFRGRGRGHAGAPTVSPPHGAVCWARGPGLSSAQQGKQRVSETAGRNPKEIPTLKRRVFQEQRDHLGTCQGWRASGLGTLLETQDSQRNY